MIATSNQDDPRTITVPMLDLRAQYKSIKAEIDASIAEVMESQHFILGQKVRECEEAIATYCETSHAVGVSSGSDALLICLMAEGIGPGDEVITTSYTFFATAGAIARVGATPVFVDIDPETYNLDTSLIDSKVTSKTRAIIPVHLFGQMADMDAILQTAAKHRLVVIEDAAQALGAKFGGRKAGACGHYGCFSFFPSKNLGAAGDAGMVVTHDSSRAEKLIQLRGHGAIAKYIHKLVGGNFRLDALQAAVISAKLRHLDAWTSARQRNAERYRQLFVESGLILADTANCSPAAFASGAADILTPAVATERHIFNQYVIRVRRRDALKAFLKTRGIDTEIYYPVPMHLQECFNYLGHVAGRLPVSETAAKETLALPIYPELREDQARHVVRCIREFFTTTV